jgi:hypothetical protein
MEKILWPFGFLQSPFISYGQLPDLITLNLAFRYGEWVGWGELMASTTLKLREAEQEVRLPGQV